LEPIPVANTRREVIDTQLAFDIGARTATARVTLGPSDTPGVSLEIGDLAIVGVRVGSTHLPYADTGDTLTLALPASTTPIVVDIAYRWRMHDWTGEEGFSGASSSGYTNTWPYHCGNLFPCHSHPADGSTFALALTGVPAGKTAVYPTAIPAPAPAPAYQVAWSIGDYIELPLGSTSAGTTVSVWRRPNELEPARSGSAFLLASFDWFEQTLGPYQFGNHVGSVVVDWPLKSYGGIEHHPLWHISATALDDPLVHVHEAAHGWFGNGIRLGCWEDFVLSEGTASYLAARALDVIAPDAGARVWRDYATQLAELAPDLPVWPDSCGQIDVVRDKLFSDAPYVRGAFFFKAVADTAGAEALDRALARFYREYAGRAARMSDLLATLQRATGYDLTACAHAWLRAAVPPVPGPCP
jgi:aminopeptidase N